MSPRFHWIASAAFFSDQSVVQHSLMIPSLMIHLSLTYPHHRQSPMRGVTASELEQSPGNQVMFYRSLTLRCRLMIIIFVIFPNIPIVVYVTIAKSSTRDRLEKQRLTPQIPMIRNPFVLRKRLQQTTVLLEISTKTSTETQLL